MKKKNVLWLILNLIFLIIFNILFFVLSNNNGVDHNMSVWISYGFIHFAYLMLLVTPKLIRKGKSAMVFGFSLYSISVTYFLLEFVTGIIFILISPESYKLTFSVQLCIAGLYGILLVTHLLTNEYTADAEEKRQSQIAYVKIASAKLHSALQKISDRETAKRVEQAYDLIHSSPVKSNTNVQLLEQQIISEIDRLEIFISRNNTEQIISIADKIFQLGSERNRQLIYDHAGK